MKTQLDKQLSQHLIDLGVPKEKASAKEIIKFGEFVARDNLGNTITRIPETAPIFRLTDLLEILPKEIEYKGEFYMIETFWNKLVKGWCAWYRTAEMIPLCLNQDIINNPTFIETELINSLYELCVFCLEQGYLKFNEL